MFRFIESAEVRMRPNLILTIVMVFMLILLRDGNSQTSAETFVWQGWEIEITNVELAESLPGLNEDPPLLPRGRYVILTLTITNISNEAHSFSGGNLVLVDTAGRSFTKDLDASSTTTVLRDLDTGDFQPGLTYSRAVVFDLPTDAVPAYVSDKDGVLRIQLDESGNETSPSNPEQQSDDGKATPDQAAQSQTPSPDSNGPQNDPVEQVTPGAMGNQEATITALITRVAVLEQTAAGTGESQTTASLVSTVEALSTRVATLESATANLQSQVATLEAGESRGAAGDPQIAGSNSDSTAGEFEISGTFLLKQSTWKSNSGCAGYGGYDDIYDGTDVIVKDQSGNIVAIGALQDSRTIPAPRASNLKTMQFNCLFQFEVAGVPDLPIYSIEVGRRGSLAYSKNDLEELNWRVEFVIGDEG